MFRSKNFTDSEKNILLSLLENYKKILECKKTDSKSAADKSKAWQQLCTEFNSSSVYIKRDVKQLQGAWKNLKARAKADAAYVRRERIKTGGGSPTQLKAETEIVQSKFIYIVCLNKCICYFG